MLSSFAERLVKRQAERDLLESQRTALIAKHATTVATLAEYTEARDVVNAVMLSTQNRAKSVIEDVVTLALKSVFGETYSFSIEYAVKRNKSEAVLSIKKGGELYNAEDECGGGIIDVVSFGLRIALWSISKQRTAPVFVLDEPGRFLSAEMAPKFGEMLKEVSKLLSLQFIMITHSEILAETADKTYRVSQTAGVSQVEPV